MNANIQLFTAAILAIIGMVLLFCGLYIDPQGEIHETVLVAYGEVLTFSGSLMGIDYRYKRKTTNDQSPGASSRRNGKSGLRREGLSTNNQ